MRGNTTRDEIEAGADLTDAEIDACKMHLREMMKMKGNLGGCVSYCQRHMGVGWSHSLRIIDYLEACGFVLSADGIGADRKPGPNWQS